MLIQPLFAHARTRPDEIAIIDDRGQVTHRQLLAMASGLSAYLSMRTQKTNVGIMLPSSAAFVASFYGTLLAGKRVVPINFLLGDKEVSHIVKDSGIDTVLSAPPLSGRLAGLPIQVIDLTQLPQPSSVSPTLHPPPIPATDPDEMAVLMYTSGTAGVPKGVMLTHRNLQSDVDACIERAKLQHEHHFLGVIPLFHSFGMTAMMLAPIQLGAKIVYIARFSAPATLNAIREHRISLMFGVPSMFAALAHLKNISKDDFSSIYAMISGGEPQPASLRQTFLDRFGVMLFEGYGLTETSPVVSLNVPQDYRAGSVGKPVPGAQVRISDEDGNALSPGQIGEIWLRGPMVMKGYYQLPVETASAMTDDGFFKTGDLGRVDADGFLFITGRKKEMMIIAGEKAYPREIEDTVLRHPAVADAAVIARRDATRGEVPVAFIVTQPGQSITTDALRSFCREQGLAAWKCPREVFIVEDLPRSPTGKIHKRTLAEQLNQSILSSQNQPRDRS